MQKAKKNIAHENIKISMDIPVLILRLNSE